MPGMFYKGGFKKTRLFIHILWIRGGGPPMWISERAWGSADVDIYIYFFYNIIIKCWNADKGRGVGQTMWIRIFLCFRPFLGQFVLF